MTALSPATRRHPRRVGARDREQAVWELLVYPRRQHLVHRDLVVLLGQYPVMTSWWRELPA